MADQTVKIAASKVRKILGTLGIDHTVGTSWDDRGGPVVVVDVPREIDRQAVLNKLDKVGANVVIRHAKRSIVAQ